MAFELTGLQSDLKALLDYIVAHNSQNDMWAKYELARIRELIAMEEAK